MRDQKPAKEGEQVDIIKDMDCWEREKIKRIRA